jgi:hypothetical protein
MEIVEIIGHLEFVLVMRHCFWFLGRVLCLAH